MTIQRRTVHLLATGVLLMILAYALPGPTAPPAGREATVLAAAASVWEDRDLRFAREDRVRMERDWGGAQRGVGWIARDGPDGAASDADPIYALPVLYPVVAASAYGALGPRGLRVLDAALYLLVFWTAWGLLGHPRGRGRLPRSGLTLAAFFFASAAPAHVLRLSPTVFEMACVFFALALWWRVRERPLWGSREALPLAAAGLFSAWAFSSEPALGLFALPPAVDLAWSRRWRAATTFVTVAAVAGVALVALQGELVGGLRWAPGWGLAEAAQIDDGALPLEDGDALSSASGAELSGGVSGAWGRNLQALLVGRHVGLVPYFPFAVFALGLYLVDVRRRGGRSRHLVAGAMVVYLGLVTAALPAAASASAAPGLAALGAVYPLFLFLPWRLRAGRAVLVPFAAAGLWAVPALVSALGPAGPGGVLDLHSRGPTFRLLPIETTLLVSGRLPGYVPLPGSAEHGVGRWWVPRGMFFHREANPEGVWVRGATRGAVYVLYAGGPPELRLRVRSISADNVLTVQGARRRVAVRFDSEAKRAGAPVVVDTEVVDRLDVDGDGVPETLSRFVLHTTHGAVPARVDPRSDDTRYLGTFLAW